MGFIPAPRGRGSKWRWAATGKFADPTPGDPDPNDYPLGSLLGGVNGPGKIPGVNGPDGGPEGGGGIGGVPGGGGVPGEGGGGAEGGAGGAEPAPPGTTPPAGAQPPEDGYQPPSDRDPERGTTRNPMDGIGLLEAQEELKQYTTAVDLSALDPHDASAVTRMLVGLSRRFGIPDNRKFFVRSHAEGSGNGIASAVNSIEEMGFKFGAVSDQTRKDMEFSGQSGWWSDAGELSGTYASVVVHEFGHYMTYIALQENGGSLITLLERLTGEEFGPNVVTKQAHGRMRSEELDEKNVAQDVSEYGSHNVMEMVAEGMMEYILADDPGRIATALGKWFTDEMGAEMRAG